MNTSSSPRTPHRPIDRREFLKGAGAAALLPYAAWGKSARTAPSNRITIGVIGWGMIGPDNTRAFLGYDDCQVVAACDLDKHRLQTAVDTINNHYGNKDCKVYHDYRELLARDDVDAMMIAIPDHWHAIVAIAAADRKKDIYGEKPLAKTVAEQQAIVRAVERNNIIWQTGSWQRSLPTFHKAAEIVRNGLIGNVTRVEVGLPGGHNDFAGNEPTFLKKMAALPNPPTTPAQVVPGTPQYEPYIECRVHLNWRWNYDTGGGQLMDWIGHHGDIAHWGLGFDLSGPSEVEGIGDFPPKNAIWNTATSYRVECTYKKEVTQYPVDVAMTIAGGNPEIKSGTKWIGTDGWVWVDRGGFDASNPAWAKMDSLPEDQRKIKLYESSEHRRNFLDCVKSRKPTITPVQVAHHSTIPGHLGLISMLTGRKLQWDVEKEEIVNDAEASALLTRPYRAPYKLG